MMLSDVSATDWRRANRVQMRRGWSTHQLFIGRSAPLLNRCSSRNDDGRHVRSTKSLQTWG